MTVTEDWCVDFQTAVDGVAGLSAYFPDRGCAQAWIAANPGAGVCVLSRRTIAKEHWGTHGAPWPVCVAPAGTTVPAATTVTETHFGVTT